MGDDSNGECSVPAYHRFKSMPANGNSLYWYSYDLGNTHVVMISTEHNCSLGSPQYSWLEKDLELVNRAKTPWLVVEVI